MSDAPQTSADAEATTAPTPGEPIEVQVNGEPMALPTALDVAGLLKHLQIDPARIAVERNRVVVRRRDHATVTLEPGDEIEIVTFVGGG